LFNVDVAPFCVVNVFQEKVVVEYWNQLKVNGATPDDGVYDNDPLFPDPHQIKIELFGEPLVYCVGLTPEFPLGVICVIVKKLTIKKITENKYLILIYKY
jgi:hypothetical protein